MLSFSTRLSYAFRCFFSLMFEGTIAEDILRVLGAAPAESPANSAPSPKPQAAKPESFDRAVQMLALLNNSLAQTV